MKRICHQPSQRQGERIAASTALLTQKGLPEQSDCEGNSDHSHGKIAQYLMSLKFNELDEQSYLTI